MRSEGTAPRPDPASCATGGASINRGTIRELQKPTLVILSAATNCTIHRKRANAEIFRHPGLPRLRGKEGRLQGNRKLYMP